MQPDVRSRAVPDGCGTRGIGRYRGSLAPWQVAEAAAEAAAAAADEGGVLYATELRRATAAHRSRGPSRRTMRAARPCVSAGRPVGSQQDADRTVTRPDVASSLGATRFILSRRIGVGPAGFRAAQECVHGRASADAKPSLSLSTVLRAEWWCSEYSQRAEHSENELASCGALGQAPAGLCTGSA